MKVFRLLEEGEIVTVFELEDRFEVRTKFPSLIGIVVCSELFYSREYRTNISGHIVVFRIAPETDRLPVVSPVSVKEEVIRL